MSEFKRLLSTEVNRKGGPSNKEQDRIYNYLMENKYGPNGYLNAPNNNARLQIKDKIERHGSYVIDTTMMKDKTARTILNEDLYGKNPEKKFKNKWGAAYVDLIAGNKEFAVKDGIAGYMMPNIYDSSDPNEIFMSTIEIEDYVDSNKIDIESKRNIGQKMTDITLRAQNTKPGQIIDFDFNKEKYNIKNSIVEKGNLSSLINDEMFAGRTFKDDLVQAIMTTTYENLGVSLSEEEIKMLDPTDDGKISFADALVIFTELMNDKERAKDYVAEYYTKFMEQNFNNNISKEVIQNQNKKENGYNPYEFA
jgi:hypothetical protein